MDRWRSGCRPIIRSFFLLYDQQNDRLREESIAPLLNKVSKFVTNPLLRAVIGQPTSSFAFLWLMDRRKILLCNLSKGALGEDVSSLLGSLIVTQLALASLSRQDTPESERLPHYLYIDEIQNFTHGMALPTILSEARKYALSLTIATQTLSQLPEESVAAVFGNCATICSFRVSGADAKELVREFGVSGEGVRTAEQMSDMIVPATELQNLPDYRLYVRTLELGRPHDPTLVTSLPPPHGRGDNNQDDLAVKESSAHYGRERKSVERGIQNLIAS